MTQDDLAAAAGVGRNTLSDIERGYASVTLLTLIRLAEALGVGPAELFETTN
jgi:transcriptional regulator with XRE-family HTH domain